MTSYDLLTPSTHSLFTSHLCEYDHGADVNKVVPTHLARATEEEQE